LGNALVAPVVAYVPEGSVDPPTAHMKFRGTITMPDAVFEKMLEYAHEAFKLHGFHDIVFLGDHGGYRRPTRPLPIGLNKEWNAIRPQRVPRPSPILPGDGNGVPKALRQPRLWRCRNRHACRASPTHRWRWLSIHISFVPIACAQVHHSDSAEGVYGDPRRASAELGQSGIELIVAHTVDAIKKAVRR
jgi:creatinine amidohydrolase/Fe(II)-dependent formamide hydrolase-like protein